MPRRKVFRLLLVPLLLLSFAWLPAQKAAAKAEPMPLADVSAGDLIAAMNTLRMANGLTALIEDPIIDAVAQSTAQIATRAVDLLQIAPPRARAWSPTEGAAP